jgi:hypothetical protein
LIFQQTVFLPDPRSEQNTSVKLLFNFADFSRDDLVDLIGIEPMTSSMPWKRAPSCATGPQRWGHPLFCWSMRNTSNARHGKLRRSSKLALVTLILISGSYAARAQAPAAVSFDVGSLRPALGTVKTTVAGLNVARWKVPGQTRTNVEADLGSIQRDLNETLPNLLSQAESAPPGSLLPAFAVFRNLDALYDVLLRITETAAFGNSSADAASLEEARAGLEDARAKLGTWLMQSIGAQDAEMVRLKTAPPPPPAAVAPTKTVIDDGPTPAKPRRKKQTPPPAAPAPQ